MAYRIFAATTIAIGLSACTTGPTSFPIEATRFHYDAMTSRGTIAVEPLPGGGPASLDYKEYAAAVQGELLRLGYAAPAPGTTPEYRATVSFTRTTRPLPPRRSPVTIGLGAGGYSGGYSGGAGVGGGVSFPLGGRGARTGVVTELSVRIRHGADAVWEGNAQSLTALDAPGADTTAVATRLARALFTGFPGDSGRTIEVK